MNKEDRNRKSRAAMDQGFKAVIHDSDILSWIIRNNVDEFMGRSIDEIKSCLKIGEDGRTVIGRDSEYDSPVHGKVVTDSIFDVRVPGTDDEVSIIINVEGQNDPNPGYPLGKRAEYYMARMVSSQKGVDFKNDEYGRLRKVYSIWCILRPRSDDRNTVVRYRMRPENIIGSPKNVFVLDTFNILVINIGGYDDSLPDALALPAVLFSQMDEKEREDVMKDRFNIILDDFLKEEVKNVITLDEDTYNHGYREGKAEGKAEGMVEGAFNNAIDTAVRLVNERGWSLEDALSFVDVPGEMRDDLESEIRRRLK